MKLKFLLATAVAALFGSIANAAIYTDTQEFGHLILRSTGGTSSYSGTFDIAAKGYNLGDNISSGSVTVVVLDQTRNEAQDDDVEIKLDNSIFTTFIGQLPFARVSLGGALGLNFIATLESTGVLNYTITALYGSFRLKSAELTVETPDGAATISLLGLGLLGLAAVRRKMA